MFKKTLLLFTLCGILVFASCQKDLLTDVSIDDTTETEIVDHKGFYDFSNLRVGEATQVPINENSELVFERVTEDKMQVSLKGNLGEGIQIINYNKNGKIIDERFVSQENSRWWPVLALCVTANIEVSHTCNSDGTSSTTTTVSVGWDCSF